MTKLTQSTMFVASAMAVFMASVQGASEIRQAQIEELERKIKTIEKQLEIIKPVPRAASSSTRTSKDRAVNKAQCMNTLKIKLQQHKDQLYRLCDHSQCQAEAQARATIQIERLRNKEEWRNDQQKLMLDVQSGRRHIQDAIVYAITDEGYFRYNKSLNLEDASKFEEFVCRIYDRLVGIVKSGTYARNKRESRLQYMRRIKQEIRVCVNNWIKPIPTGVWSGLYASAQEACDLAGGADEYDRLLAEAQATLALSDTAGTSTCTGSDSGRISDTPDTDDQAEETHVAVDNRTQAEKETEALIKQISPLTDDPTKYLQDSKHKDSDDFAEDQ